MHLLYRSAAAAFPHQYDDRRTARYDKLPAKCARPAQQPMNGTGPPPARRTVTRLGRRVLGGWFHRSAQKTEFVALGVGEYVPGFLAGLSHVGLSGAELEKTL